MLEVVASCIPTLGSRNGDGRNTDPQSMDYPNGLPNWTTLKWTTHKNNNPNESYLMFLAASIYYTFNCLIVHPAESPATSLNIVLEINNC